MRKSLVFQEVFQAEEQELSQLDFTREDLQSQFSVNTATWALDIYEKELKIKTNKTKSFEERRSVIKSKWRGVGKVDRRLIQLVAESFVNGSVNVHYDQKIFVEFVDTLGIPSNVEDLQAQIEEIKPAHIGLQFIFTYMTWNELDDYTFVWDQLNFTWNEYEAYKE